MNDKSAPEVAQWLVVHRADGVVDSVEGGAPMTWLGQALVDAPGTAGVLRQAAAELLLAPPTLYVRRRTVRCVDDRQHVDVAVLLVEALPLRRTHMRVNELVMRTLDLFASQAKSNNIDLTIDQAEGVPPAVVLDGEKIAWALSTLVANARRYARTHVAVHVRGDDKKSGLVVDVTDDGPGMPERQTRWLFDRTPQLGNLRGSRC